MRRREGRSRLGVIGCFAIGLLTLTVLLVLAIISGTLLTLWDLRQTPPPGQMIDIGGYRLHIHCVGQGSPTVILDSGAGGTSLDWSWIQPRLAQSTRVCAYDRAGAAWSDSGPPPRDAAHMADELATLLTHARIPGPYILVGASFGGHVQRLYAAGHPQAVVGLVLVDARPEGFDTRYPQIRRSRRLYLCRLCLSLSSLEAWSATPTLPRPMSNPVMWMSGCPPATPPTLHAATLYSMPTTARTCSRPRPPMAVWPGASPRS